MNSPRKNFTILLMLYFALVLAGLCYYLQVMLNVQHSRWVPMSDAGLSAHKSSCAGTSFPANLPNKIIKANIDV